MSASQLPVTLVGLRCRSHLKPIRIENLLGNLYLYCFAGGSSPSGEFRFVAISDCAHLCELYRSRGCDAFHYNGANLNGKHNRTAVYPVVTSQGKCALKSWQHRKIISQSMQCRRNFFLELKRGFLCLLDVDSCTLVSGASRETVFSGNAFITTFFLDTSIHRPRGIVAIDGFWTHIGEAEAYRSIAPGKPIPVLTKDGMQ